MRRFLMISVSVLAFGAVLPAHAQDTAQDKAATAVTGAVSEAATKAADTVDTAATAAATQATDAVKAAAEKPATDKKQDSKKLDSKKDDKKDAAKAAAVTPAETPKTEAPKAETPKAEAAKTETPKAEVAKTTLAALLSKDGKADTFLSLLKAAGMEGILTGKDAHTLFIPTDSAFDDKDKGKLASLKKPENKAQLVDLLNFHIVNGMVPRSALDNNSSEVLTATLKRLRVVGKSGKLTVNGIAIEDKEGVADNGVAYTIDKVIEAEAGRPVAAAPAGSATETKDAKPETGEKAAKKPWYKF